MKRKRYFRIPRVFILIFLLLLFSNCRGLKKGLPPNFYDPNNQSKQERYDQFLKYAEEKNLPPKLRVHPESQGYGLVIGIEDDNYSRTKKLKKPKEEAGRMREILDSSGYAVCPLINEKARKKDIIDWLNFFREISEVKDKFIFYYSGHGGSIKDEFYIIPYLEGKEEKDVNVAKFLGSQEILKELKKAKFSIVVMIIDACSAFNSPLLPPSITTDYFYNLEQQAFLFSCNTTPVNYEGDFSNIIFNALTGVNASNYSDKDVVTAFEFIDYVDKNWKKFLRLFGMGENTVKNMIYCGGDFALTVRKK